MRDAPVGVLGVPSSAAAHGPGLERLPEALRAAGLVPALQGCGLTVVDHGSTTLARWRPDAPTRTNPHDVLRVAGVLREARAALEPLLAAGHWPVVVGGECTVTIAVLAALADAGRDVGLVYVDGGQDLQLPPDHPDEPIADSMGVAHLLDLPGTHAELAGIGPRRPLLAADRLCFVGYSDDEEDVHGFVPSERIPAADVLDDPVAAARHAAAAVDGDFVVHLDVDVLDDCALPLADVPQHGRGLDLPALGAVLTELVQDPACAGLVVVEANPDRDDEQGTHLRALVELLRVALTPR